MPRAVWISSLLVAAGASTVAAKPAPPDYWVERPIVIAGDPQPPPPDPEPEPPPPPRHASIALVSGGTTFASDAQTALERFGPSGTMGFVHLSHRDEPGVEVLAGATGGDRGRSYAASVRLVITPRVRRKDAIAPFLALGPAFAIARLDEGDMKGSGAGLGLGPSGAIGLHGFLSHRVYWRASAGFTGAGIGTFNTDLGLGWVIDK